MSLVSLMDTKKVPFPWVTVCLPSQAKWLVLVKLLHHFDKEKLIYDFIKRQHSSIQNIFSSKITIPQDILPQMYDFEVVWSQKLPLKLKLNSIEEEVMFLIHFTTYTLQKSQEVWMIYRVLDLLLDFQFKSILNKTSREGVARGMKDFICKYDNSNIKTECPFLKNPLWFECDYENQNESFIYGADYAIWCKDCNDFNRSCMSEFMNDVFLKTMLKSHTMTEHITEYNFIYASVMAMFDSKEHWSPDALYEFDKFEMQFAKYIDKVEVRVHPSLE